MILKDTRVLFFYLFLILTAAYSLFGVPSPKDSQRIAFVNNALRYLGTPYRYAGHSPKGMDCSGFVYRNGSEILKLQMPRRRYLYRCRKIYSFGIGRAAYRGYYFEHSRIVLEKNVSFCGQYYETGRNFLCRIDHSVFFAYNRKLPCSS